MRSTRPNVSHSLCPTTATRTPVSSQPCGPTFDSRRSATGPAPRASCGPADLATVLGGLAPVAAPDRLLVSADTGDDAAAWRLGDGRALIATVDVFTPIVDDAYDWGRVAATNALSDVYAMGGEPAFVLNVAGWPVDDLPLELLGRVLQGGQDVAVAAGAVVAGGHTITATEPIYGMVAVGFAEADRLLRNSTGRPGQRLFLTKPIGLGLITTAIKRGRATPEQAEAAVRTMTTLNAAAAAAAVAAGAGAATDVTGFGLLGHLRKLLEASGIAAGIEASAVPLLPGVLELARAGVVAGGSRRNHAWLQRTTGWGGLDGARTARAGRCPDLRRAADRGDRRRRPGGGAPGARGGVRGGR